MSTQQIPSAVATIESTSVISPLGFYKPEFLAKLFRRHGDQGLLSFDLYKSLGWMMPVAQETYSHFEDDYIHEDFNTLNGVAQTGAGVAQLITLDPTNLDSGNRFYPRQGDVVRYTNDMTGVITLVDVTTPSAPILTVVPAVSTNNLPALTAGDTIIISSGTQGEGSTLTKGALSKTNEYTNQLQIIPERFDVTGTEMTNQDWFTTISDPNGGALLGYYIYGQQGAEYRLKLKMSNALLFGELSDNNTPLVDPNSVVGASYKTTQGLIPYIKQEGQNIPYNPAFLSVNQFYEIGRRLNKENAQANDIMVMAGLPFLQNKDTVFWDYTKNHGMDATQKRFSQQYFQGSDSLELAVNFGYLNFDYHTYAFMNVPQFTNPKLGGAPGYKDPNLAIFIPMKKQKTSEGDVPSLGMRYKQFGAHNRMMQLWTQGAAGAAPAQYVGLTDVQTLMWRAHIGGHAVCGNQMIRLFDNT